MSYKCVAIIPARGGSSRIPKKNIKDFFGKPIIAYPIEAALQSNCFDEVMVSTDSAEIAHVAQKHGAQIPFMRSPENALDSADLADVLEEVLYEYQKKGKNFDYLCCILATASLITSDQLRKGFEIMMRHEAASVISVVKLHYHVQHAWKFDGTSLDWIFPQYRRARSQTLDDAYYDMGSLYWINVEKFLNQNRRKELIVPPALPLIIQEHEAQDIDNLDDWKMAEEKFLKQAAIGYGQEHQ